MNWLALLLLMVGLIAGEVPGLVRPVGTGVPVLAYDLSATAPWMPLLWERLVLTLPSGASACEATAQLVSVSGRPIDANGLLALRDGHRLTLQAASLLAGDVAGRWNGVQIGGSALVAGFDRPVEAATLLLVLKQLHYADLGGVRSANPGRVSVVVRALVGGLWLSSTPLLIDLSPVAVDQPPRLRFDDLAVPLGGSAAWVPLGCYDPRTDVTALRWRTIVWPATGLDITDTTGSGRTGDYAAWQPLDLFARAGLRVQPSGVEGILACAVQVDDGVAGTLAPFTLTVLPPTGALAVVGDFPFAVTARTTLVFRTSHQDAVLTGSEAHPSSAPLHATALLGQRVDDHLEVIIDPADHPGVDELAGCAIFTSGASVYRLPYRINLPGGTAN